MPRSYTIHINTVYLFVCIYAGTRVYTYATCRYVGPQKRDPGLVKTPISTCSKASSVKRVAGRKQKASKDWEVQRVHCSLKATNST